MPTRIIREGILTSEPINSLSERAELFYRRLMSVADDHGRYFANPTLLRAACYPLKVDAVTDKQVAASLAECTSTTPPLIVLYGGDKYLQIANFRQQTRGKSKFPDFAPEKPQVPPNQLLSKCKTDAKPMLIPDGGGGGGEVVCGGGGEDDILADGKPSADVVRCRFAEFWQAYPKKTGRKPTETKWKAKRLDARADELIADVKRRMASDRKWIEGYVPNPLTYLTQERWQDEIQTAGEKQGGGGWLTKTGAYVEGDRRATERIMKEDGL